MSEVDDLFNQLEGLNQGNGYQDNGLPGSELQPIPVTTISPDLPAIDVRRHVERHEAISDEILASWRSDRQEAQTAVNFLKHMIDTIIAAGDRPSGAMLESYVRAMEVKGNTNATAVRLIDATAKLLAATKPSAQVNNNQLNIGNRQELIDALSRPASPEDP